MERRQNALCDVKMCRFCLSRDDTLKSLYDRDRTRTQKNVVPLPLKILSSLAVEVFPSDHLPMFICERCRFFMDICYEFKQICREADELTYQYIQTGSNMKGINWPTSLIKIFNKCTSKTVLKTVVEGGTTVQVTHGVSDSEDEIDSVYNVKYDVDDDGKEISATLCQEKDDSNDIDSMHIKRGYKSWPCDECDCNYPLKQLLKLHKMQKHKDKDVHCDIDPDAKYFSKGKLTSHGQSNLEEYPYQCTICGKGYQRLSLLKRHEKSVHADLPQLACAQCPSTFLSMEQLKAHQIRHGSSAIRPLPCDQCGRRFVDKWALHVHKKNAHTQQPGFCCEYCPEKFNSITKLTRHVRTHAGTRSYPCKYCDKNFVKSHHYTRHLRMKHPWETRGDRNPNTKAVPTNEGYRCDQCDATLATQDDLIYHSAIHATQNLTCPLCQEKFRNVDEVTSHIKSHCSGNEYMCNYCELIFTTQEKLDTHTMTVHEDEIEHIHDESSMEVEDLEDDDCSIQVKEEGNEMVVEIKKPNDYLIQPERNENIFEFDDNRTENTNSEESENENETYEEQPNLSNVIHIEDRQGRIHYVMPSQKIVEHPKDIIIKAKEPKPVVQQKDPITLQKEAIAQKELVVQSNVVVQQKDATLQRIEPVVQQAQAVTQQTEAVVQQTDVFLQPKQEPERSEDTELPETSTDTDVQKSNKDDGSEVDSTPLILRKAEMVRRKLQAAGVNTSTIQSSEKKEKPKPEGNSAGASDKSLRLLEKELQELKRTNPRQEVKTPVKTELRRKPQLHTSTPKPSRISEDKKNQASKSPAVEKKPVLRAAVKENKEPKEKETKPSVKEEKEKEQLKTVVKNGANDKDVPEEGVRRSTRPSKIKDYAKMIRTQDSDDDNSEMDEEEYVEEKTPEVKGKPRRGSVKAPKTAQLTPAKPMPCIVTRKRGRPRKDGGVTETPAKQVKKNDDNEESEEDNDEAEFTGKNLDNCKNYMKDTEESKTEDAKSAPIVSPSGQTLKKVPIKALPPGVKPMPLPSNARPMGPGEVTEMQIGKKMVKVQKIVMTKAEVEAMAKKGLVEMKGGTMVLKQGIKLPSADAITLKSSVGSQGEKSQTTPAPSVSTDKN